MIDAHNSVSTLSNCSSYQSGECSDIYLLITDRNYGIYENENEVVIN